MAARESNDDWEEELEFEALDGLGDEEEGWEEEGDEGDDTEEVLCQQGPAPYRYEPRRRPRPEPVSEPDSDDADGGPPARPRVGLTWWYAGS